MRSAFARQKSACASASMTLLVVRAKRRAARRVIRSRKRLEHAGASPGASHGRMRVATIADVARHAGVSMSTVSHVVNQTRKVDPTTAAVVKRAIAEIGYTPNTIARALARSATGTVGIAISALSNPYFRDILCAIES